MSDESKPASDRTEFLPANLKTERPPAPLAVLSPQEMAVYCSAKLDTEEQRMHAMQALTNEVPEARNHEGKEIDVSFIVGCWGKEVETDTGEVVTLRKWVFVSPTGEMLKASGRTIPQTVGLAAATFQLGPWNPPVRFRVRLVKSPPPKSPTVFMDCLGRAPAAGKKEGGKRDKPG